MRVEAFACDSRDRLSHETRVVHDSTTVCDSTTV